MNLLKIDKLTTCFPSGLGVLKVVDGVSFEIAKGEVFGLVGESGSGKTLTALSVLKLIALPGRILGGSVVFNGVDLIGKDEEYMRSVRGSKISIVFQEPSSALDPVFTIGYQLTEAVLVHQRMNKERAKDIALEFLNRAHIKDPAKVYHDYPHQLSGGTKQRIMIAMALVNSPELLILDEPTTALDVTIQAQILDLLDEIRAAENISILFISHDFGVIARMCDKVGVMYKGRILETGKTKEILNDPRKDYTRSLLESVKALA